MALIVNLSFFIFFALILIASGGFLIKSLLKISSFLRLTEFVVAFVIMAISTSIPELFVGINSAIIGKPSIALGTVIGSNIADLTLVIGVVILLSKGIKIKSKFIRRDSIWMFAFALLPILLMLIGSSISRIDGVILLTAFFAFVFFMIRQKREFEAKVENNVKRWEIFGNFFIFIISLLALFFSSDQLVKYGSNLAIDLMMPPIFVGLFFIALGTSLPELVFESRAALAKHPQLALGDMIGSVVANSSLVLGVTALIMPITADIYLFLTSAAFMLVICFLFSAFVYGSKISWMHGIALIFFYVLFLVIELSLKGFIPRQTILFG